MENNKQTWSYPEGEGILYNRAKKNQEILTHDNVHGIKVALLKSNIFAAIAGVFNSDTIHLSDLISTIAELENKLKEIKEGKKG